MAVEMYSINPSFFGGAALVTAGWMAGRSLEPGTTPGMAPYVLAGFGYLCYLMALPTTASVGLHGILKVCAVMGGLASAIAARLAWKGPYLLLKWTFVAGGATVFAWGWIKAVVIARNEAGPVDPPKEGP